MYTNISDTARSVNLVMPKVGIFRRVKRNTGPVSSSKSVGEAEVRRKVGLKKKKRGVCFRVLTPRFGVGLDDR